MPDYPEMNSELPQQAAVGDENIPAARAAYSLSFLHLAIYALAGFLLTNGLVALLGVTGVYQKLSLNWKYIVQFAPMYLIAFPIYLLISRKMETHAPEKQHMNVGQIILAFFCCETISVACNYIGIIVNAILTRILGVQTSSDFIEEGVFGESNILFGCLAVIFAPFIEEMLFRKVLIDRVRKYGDKAAILLSGIMFGLFHGNFTQFFYAAALGMFFAFIYVRTGRVRYTITLHMMMNSVGTVVPMIFGKYLKRLDELSELLENNDISGTMQLLGEIKPLLIFVICMWAVIITGFVLLIVFRKRFRVNPPAAPLPKGKRFTTACVNVGCILFVLFCIGEFILQIMQNIPNSQE